MFLKQYRINRMKCKIAKYITIVNELNNTGIPEREGYAIFPRSIINEIIRLKGKVSYMKKKIEIMEAN